MVIVHLLTIFLAAILTHNIALTYLLGMCPFVSLSRNLRTASGMGIAVIFVVTLTTIINWPIYNLILVPTGSTIIYYVVFIIVIAATVQLVEMFVKKLSPSLFRSLGIFLPLITTNCAILGLALFQTAKEYDFIQSVVYALGAGAGFTLALMLMAGLREKLELAELPSISQGAAMSLMLGGLLSLSFMGFAGLGGQ